MDLTIEHQIGISPTARSAAAEDYLKAIYVLGQDDGRVTTSLLAAYLGFAPPSVTGMLQKLAKLELVIYTPRQALALRRTRGTGRTAGGVRRLDRRLHLQQPGDRRVPGDGRRCARAGDL